jgi:hypothetical protein
MEYVQDIIIVHAIIYMMGLDVNYLNVMVFIQMNQEVVVLYLVEKLEIVTNLILAIVIFHFYFQELTVPIL